MFRLILATLCLIAVFWLAKTNIGAPPTSAPIRTSLATIMADPDAYEAQLVTVSGRVGNRLSLVGYGGMMLEDSNGHTIAVIGVTTPPPPGTSMTVTGQLLTAFTAGTFTAPVILVRGQG